MSRTFRVLQYVYTYRQCITVDPVISKALYFHCCAGCCIIDLFRVYNFRCCLHKTVLDFRINRECKKFQVFNFRGKFTIANITKIKATAKLTGSMVHNNYALFFMNIASI